MSLVPEQDSPFSFLFSLPSSVWETLVSTVLSPSLLSFSDIAGLLIMGSLVLVLSGSLFQVLTSPQRLFPMLLFSIFVFFVLSKEQRAGIGKGRKRKKK